MPSSDLNGTPNSEAVSRFREAMAVQGIVAHAEIIPDGNLHRFHVEGDRPGKKNGWYILRLQPWPCGAFGSWKLNVSHKWKLPGRDSLNREQRAALQNRITEAEAACRAELERTQAEARKEAASIWQRAKPAPVGHGYLKEKQIKPHGAKLHERKLVLPVRDVEGTLHSLQFISADGDKRFLEGERVAGCFCLLGEIGKRLYVAEGFATGATIHEATDHAVAVAFNAGNLKPVAECLRKKYPKTELVIAGDDDTWTENNPGRTKALATAKAIRCKVALPKFRDTQTKPTDFNDLFRLEGAGVVREQLGRARTPEMWESIPGKLASEITPEEVKWLWPGWIPRQELTLLDGDPGMGKSAITLDLVARVTKGWEMPDGADAEIPPRGAVIISTEDTASTTIVPRLVAAGADCDRVRIITEIKDKGGVSFSPELAQHEKEIEAAIRDVDAALLVVDPLVSSLDAKTDTHKDQQVRRNLTTVKRLAVRTGLAVVGLRHFTKGGEGNPLYRGQGSIAFTGAARSQLLVGHNPDDPTQNVLAVGKCNLAERPQSLRYGLGPPGGVLRITWEGESQRTAVDLLVDSGGEEERSKQDDAAEFLNAMLANGRQDQKDIVIEARQQAISERTLWRARKKLGVRTEREGQGKEHKSYWSLSLPAKEPPLPATLTRLAGSEQIIDTTPIRSDTFPLPAKWQGVAGSEPSKAPLGRESGSPLQAQNGAQAALEPPPPETRGLEEEL